MPLKNGPPKGQWPRWGFPSQYSRRPCEWGLGKFSEQNLQRLESSSTGPGLWTTAVKGTLRWWILKAPSQQGSREGGGNGHSLPKLQVPSPGSLPVGSFERPRPRRWYLGALSRASQHSLDPSAFSTPAPGVNYTKGPRGGAVPLRWTAPRGT